MWADLFRLWTVATQEPDPLSRRQRARDIEGAGVTDAQAMPDLRSDGGYLSGGKGTTIRLRDSSDFIDLSSVTNRQSRYKEYERLRTVAEIETAMTVFADESCVTGDTLIATPFGYFSIKDLANTKDPKEEFLVYCYDFGKEDYTLGWAFHPRLVKRSSTIKIILDNGTYFSCTSDHRVLLRSGKWIEAGQLKYDDELMPFYRLKADQQLTEQKTKQFSRVFTLRDDWKTERQFMDEWRSGRKTKSQERLSKIIRYIRSGLNTRQIAELMHLAWPSISHFIVSRGFSYKELHSMANRFPDRRRVLRIVDNGEQDVYDLSVNGHENFATNTTIFHNCQIGENGHLFEIVCKDKDVKEELDFLFFHPKMLNMDRRLWNMAKNLYFRGDHFLELVIDPEEPKSGILKFQNLPADSIYRIETIKGKLLEFQQSKDGPDYQSLARVEVTKATPADLAQATAIRFTPSQIVHFKIGDDRQQFYPYGVSLVEAARGPAHQLKLLEDAMLVYRLCLIGDTSIRTCNGNKKIADIVNRDKVWTLQTDGKLVQSIVINWVNNGIKKVYTVKSKCNEITGTSNHQILVHDKKEGDVKYVAIKDLILKQHQFINIKQDVEIPAKIILPKTDRMRLSDKQREIYASLHLPDKKSLILESLTELGIEITKNNIQKCWTFLVHKDKVAAPTELAEKLCEKFGLGDGCLPCNRYQKNPERITLPEYVTEDFARLFGFLLGDGCLNYDGTSARILFSTSPDDEMNEKYRLLLEKFFGKATFRQDKRKRKGIGEYQVCSRHACNILKEMGYICGAHNKRIPSWAFTERKSVRLALIEGLVDADGGKRGTKEKTWNSTIGLCNKNLVSDIREIWRGLGMSSSNIREKSGGDKLFNGVPAKTTCTYITRITKTPLPQYEDILSVEYSGEKEVFDISVDNPVQNFIANGIPVHNSRAPERRVFYIDVGQLPPFKMESFMERMKDTLRKKKTFSAQGGLQGAGPVEERWTPFSQDEDFFIPLRPNSATRVETLPGACLALDTKIPLLDGRTLTLQEMINEYNAGKQNWVYSCSATGEVAPGIVSWAGVTRKNAEVVKVTFDNEESVTCTPDHKFPVQGVGKIEAKNLKAGDSMFPFNTRLESLQPNRKGKYLQIYNTATKKWIFVHRLVARYLDKTKYRQDFAWKDEYKDSVKNVIHHLDYNKFNNDPSNLAWMNWTDHILYHRENQHVTNENISNSLKKFHANLSQKDKKKRDSILAERSKNGTVVLSKKLKDEDFNNYFRQRQKEGWIKAKLERAELHKERSRKITERNNLFWSDPENKKQVFAKQTVVYPKLIFDNFVGLVKQGMLLEEILPVINANKELIDLFVSANKHIKRKGTKFEQGLTDDHAKKMVKAYGYKGIKHLRKDANLFNHKVIKVEFLEERIDTGTLTIDSKEELHDYHTFAISPYVFTSNSNLGEIDDALYFRNKLFIALNFPKNYMAQEDAALTKVTLSSVDVKFARLVERLQASLADGLCEIAVRHLELRGFPDNLYEDLQIKITPPSPYREMSLNEVMQARFDRAMALKGSQILSDLDIMTRILKYSPEDAKEMVSRATIQKLQELKLQVMAQNPQLLGIAMPAQAGTEMGTSPGGPNPALGGEGAIPGTLPPPAPGTAAPPGEAPPAAPAPGMMKKMAAGEEGSASNTYGQPQTPQAQPLPEPDPLDIKRYDLDIENFSKELDDEELDISELDDI